MTNFHRTRISNIILLFFFLMGKKVLWVFTRLKGRVLVKKKISNIKTQQKTASFYATGHKKLMFTVSILLNNTQVPHFSHLYVFEMKALSLWFPSFLRMGFKVPKRRPNIKYTPAQSRLYWYPLIHFSNSECPQMVMTFRLNDWIQTVNHYFRGEHLFSLIR